MSRLLDSRRRASAWAAAAALLCANLAFAAEPDPTAAEPIDRSLLLAYLADTTTFTLLDARSADEFDVGHIHGAVNVPHDAVEAFAAALPDDRSAPVVVYCRTGKRAALLAEQLAARGYTDVRVLAPAQMFWSDTAPMFNCGLPAAAGETPRVTPVPAGRAPDTAISLNR